MKTKAPFDYPTRRLICTNDIVTECWSKYFMTCYLVPISNEHLKILDTLWLFSSSQIGTDSCRVLTKRNIRSRRLCSAQWSRWTPQPFTKHSCWWQRDTTDWTVLYYANCWQTTIRKDLPNEAKYLRSFPTHSVASWRIPSDCFSWVQNVRPWKKQDSRKSGRRST